MNAVKLSEEIGKKYNPLPIFANLLNNAAWLVTNGASDITEIEKAAGLGLKKPIFETAKEFGIIIKHLEKFASKSMDFLKSPYPMLKVHVRIVKSVFTSILEKFAPCTGNFLRVHVFSIKLICHSTGTAYCNHRSLVHERRTFHKPGLNRVKFVPAPPPIIITASAESALDKNLCASIRISHVFGLQSWM